MWTQTQICQQIVRSRSLLLLLLAGLIAMVAPEVEAGLVSHWNFDDGATVTDQFGMNDGTVIHNAGFSSDTPDGSAFSLDLSATGVGPQQDYVRIGPAAVGAGEPAGRDLGIAETNSFSIAAWVNYSSSQRGIVTIQQDLTSGGGDRSGLTFGIDGSGSPFVGIIASDEIGDVGNGGATFRDITTDQNVPTGQWAHIAATYDNETDTLVTYVNGESAASYFGNPGGTVNEDGTNVLGGVGIDFFDNDGSFTGFGAAGNSPQHGDSAGDFTRLFYDGLLDDVGLWDEALPADAIMGLADGSRTVPTALDPFLGILGDFNDDTMIDLVDFDILRMNFNEPGVFADGDINFSGFIDFQDFKEFKVVYAEANPGAGPLPLVPEPSPGVVAILGVALVAIVFRRRSRSFSPSSAK